MAKKNKQNKPPQNTPNKAVEPARPLISKRGFKVIGGGIALVIVGYFILSMADPMGQNWAATVSPFVILGGYATIGIGIVLKDPVSNPIN